jgi:hypothetical protein
LENLANVPKGHAEEVFSSLFWQILQWRRVLFGSCRQLYESPDSKNKELGLRVLSYQRWEENRNQQISRRMIRQLLTSEGFYSHEEMMSLNPLIRKLTVNTQVRCEALGFEST